MLNDEKNEWENNIGKIVHADCLEFMKKLPDKCVGLVLTDPPYNAKNIGPNARVYEGQRMQLPDEEYKEFCSTWINEALRVSERVVFTPGIANICNYPQPYWVICWHKPAARSFNRMGGFNAWEPIFVYGKTPKGKHLGQDYLLHNVLSFSKGPEKDHPCPKCLSLWQELVFKFSIEEEIVFDPFSGSGTTAIACHREERRFICVEKEKKYVNLSIKRLRQEQAQLNLFRD